MPLVLGPICPSVNRMSPFLTYQNAVSVLTRSHSNFYKFKYVSHCNQLQDQTGPNRTGLDRTGQDRTGLDQTGLDRTGQKWIEDKTRTEPVQDRDRTQTEHVQDRDRTRTGQD